MVRVVSRVAIGEETHEFQLTSEILPGRKFVRFVKPMVDF